MGLPQLDSCCCGCSLKTGTMIIGIIDLIASTIFMILGIVANITLNSVDDEKVQNHLTLLHIICIVMTIFYAIQLVISIFLLVGVSKERPDFILPWIIYMIISFCFYIIYTIVTIILYSIAGNIITVFSSLSTAIITMCLQFYVFLVVYSFYRRLKNPETSTTVCHYQQPPPYYDSETGGKA